MDINAILQLTLITNMSGGGGGSTMPDGTICRQDSYRVEVQAVCNHMIGPYKLRFVAMGDMPWTNFTIITYIPPVPVFTNPTSRPPPVMLPQSAGAPSSPIAEPIPGAPAFTTFSDDKVLPPVPLPPPPAPAGFPSAPRMSVPPPPKALAPLPARTTP